MSHFTLSLILGFTMLASGIGAMLAEHYKLFLKLRIRRLERRLQNTYEQSEQWLTAPCTPPGTREHQSWLWFLQQSVKSDEGELARAKAQLRAS